MHHIRLFFDLFKVFQLLMFLSNVLVSMMRHLVSQVLSWHGVVERVAVPVSSHLVIGGTFKKLFLEIGMPVEVHWCVNGIGLGLLLTVGSGNNLDNGQTCTLE